MRTHVGAQEGLRAPAGQEGMCVCGGNLQEEGGTGWNHCYQLEDSSTSGARYQRVATYSVRAWPSGPSGRSLRERARPKSHSFTRQLASRRTLDGWERGSGLRADGLGLADTEVGAHRGTVAGAWVVPSDPGG